MIRPILNNPEQQRTNLKNGNMMDLIRYINKVEVIDAKYLASSTFFGKGVKLDDALTFVPLCTIGLATFEISEKVESKNRVFHHSLKAKLSERIDVENRKLCFRLTGRSKRVWTSCPSRKSYQKKFSYAADISWETVMESVRELYRMSKE